MKTTTRWIAAIAAILLSASISTQLGTANAAVLKSHDSFKHYRVKGKLKHYIENAPDYTDYFWTDLYFYDDGSFYDGEDWGTWKYDGEEIHASVSNDFEDEMEWENPGADDVDAWFKYTDVFVSGDKIKGKMKGEVDIEWDFFFFDPDYHEKMKGTFSGYEVDDDGSDDWSWWPW